MVTDYKWTLNKPYKTGRQHSETQHPTIPALASRMGWGPDRGDRAQEGALYAFSSLSSLSFFKRR